MVWILVLVLLAVISPSNSQNGYNVALHAQLHPDSGKVVGSVLTTDGLKAALGRRFDVHRVEVFYPSRYAGYLEHEWDFVLVEGWFPSIDTFLLLTRNHHPSAKIVFLCLDPIYPGVDIVQQFDVDGVLTNSNTLVAEFAGHFPADFMLLAADPEEMRPLPDVARSWGAVYVGAGGQMLQYKPDLHALLAAAVPYGLRLHGAAWEGVAVLGALSRGPLPRPELAQAYASAQAVLASTIAAQSQHSMVNNRIFEALSCGALVVARHSKELEQLGCAAILFVNESHPLGAILGNLSDSSDSSDSASDSASDLRLQAREFVLRRHTWAHRAVEVLDFSLSLGMKEDDICGPARCERAHCPTLLWLVSAHLRLHQDYLFVAGGMRQLCAAYRVTTADAAFVGRITSQSDHSDHSDQSNQSNHSDQSHQSHLLDPFDVLLAFITPFDALDRAIRARPTATLHRGGGPYLQKRACYIIGFGGFALTGVGEGSIGEGMSGIGEGIGTGEGGLDFDHFDLVWFRSRYELDLLGAVVRLQESRLQHAFGVGSNIVGSNIVGGVGSNIVGSNIVGLLPRVVVVCFWAFREHCSSASRTHHLSAMLGSRDVQTILLLLGGRWEDWGVLYGELRNTVHVGEGRVGGAVRVVQQSRWVLIMHPRIGATTPTPTPTPTPTTTDILWPMVAAVVAGASIYLLSEHAHLTSLTECASWDEQYLGQAIRLGLDRLHGFAPARSRVRGVVCDASTLAGSEGSETDIYEGQTSSFLGVSSTLMRLDLTSFQIGRDGECCFEIEISGLSPPANGRICLLRPYRYIAFRPQMGAHACTLSDTLSDTLSEVNATVSLMLRGSFFGDVFFRGEFPIQLSFRAHSSDSSTPAQSEWLERNSIYVASVPVC